MKSIRHTLESCKKSASNYKTRNQWKKGDLSSYSSAKHNGWYNECCVNMVKFEKYTLDYCKEIASKYKTKIEWRKEDYKTLSYATSKGWIDECCFNMIPLRRKKREHTLDSCKEIASNYKTRMEWKKQDAGSYQTACKKDWLNECCVNMTYSTRKKHTLESCKETASKYRTKSEWIKSDGSSYQTACRKGWLNECFVVLKKAEKNNLKVKDKIDTNIYKHHKNKGGFYHKQPLGLNVTKAKNIAIKDISEDDYFKRNYIQYDHVIYMLKNCPLQYYTLDLEIY